MGGGGTERQTDRGERDWGVGGGEGRNNERGKRGERQTRTQREERENLNTTKTLLHFLRIVV